jgi:hypothetical protein
VSSVNITPQQMLDAIQRVPEERWPEVLRTIEKFRTQLLPDSPSPTRIQNGIDLRGSDLIGIWADRTDIGNGHEYARSLRREPELRQ